jgi:peptide/nickel transport system substrate-binding protein
VFVEAKEGKLNQWMRIAVAFFGVLVTACAPAATPQPAAERATQAPAAPSESRLLQVAIPVEPATMAARSLEPIAQNLYLARRMVNAELAALDDRGNPRPYLAESLPQLNTDSWRVFPDGQMETTFRLRPGLTWHDGTLATANDYVFGWRVYSTPAFGQAFLPPYSAISEVTAPDASTVVVRWKQPYSDVLFLGGLGAEFAPLPRHLLESATQPDQPEALVNSPFWTREYIGMGPYRISSWELGAFMEMSAFDGHAWGRPKIDRLKLLFSTPQSATARLLSGEVQLSAGVGLDLPSIKREWISRGSGSVHLHPNQWQAVHVQFRPEYQASRPLLNPTVRKALAHTVDRALLNETILEGDGIMLDSPVSPHSIWAAAADRGAVKYLFDVRRSEQLMAEAGFVKGSDGIYISPSEGRLSFEVKGNAGATEPVLSFLAAGWRKVGFEAQESVLPAALGQNPEVRATYPGTFFFQQNCCESALLGFTSASVGTAENRWAGGNRSGWHDPEYDVLASALAKTLERGERERHIARLVQILTDQVQSINVQNVTQPWLYGKDVRGLTLVPPEANMSWNIHEWENR